MIEYVWKIKKIDRKANTGEVVSIHWTVVANSSGYTANMFGSTNINYSEEYTFIPFEELTEEVVLNWVWNNINKTEIEETLLTKISEIETPVIISGLPWN